MVYTITVLLGLYLTISKDQIASWETECFSADEEISNILLNKKVNYHIHNNSQFFFFSILRRSLARSLSSFLAFSVAINYITWLSPLT